jgi:CRISPR-associated endonuclease Cas1 subtype I-E
VFSNRCLCPRLWERARQCCSRKRLLPHRDIAVLRGIEGSRVKVMYQVTAQRFGLTWSGRRYDRANPNATDLPNQAINHAASAVEAAAAIAVTATATIPQLGFIHEDSGQSFVLDIADLYRDTVTVPEAFRAVSIHTKRPAENMEAPPHTRGWTRAAFRSRETVHGSPAHAGMDPRVSSRAFLKGRLPRTRGDGPCARK